MSQYLYVIYSSVCGMPFVNKTILSPLCILATLSKARWLCVWDVLTRSVVSDSLQLHELYLARFLCPWGFSRQKYWSGLACPSPGDLPNPGIELRSVHCHWILYQLSHKRSPKIWEWVAYPFSSRSSWPRNWTKVSCITVRFFIDWAIRESPI